MAERRANYGKYSKYHKSAAPTKTAKQSDKNTDFVFVYSISEIEANRQKLNTILIYMNNIKETGLQIDEEQGTILDDLFCLKISAPKPVLIKYANLFKVELSQDHPNYKHRKVRSKCLRTILTNPVDNDPIVQRAPESLSGNVPTDFTSAERILIVNQILLQTKHGMRMGETGYEQLVKRKIFLAAYPLHDSPYEWTEEGPLSDRQLLARYWANLGYCLKAQPLHLIEKYFGTEVGFYYAWIGFYTKMLIPATILGLVCFIIGIIYYVFERHHIINNVVHWEGTYSGRIMDYPFITSGDVHSDEVCESDQLLCPVCPSHEWCSFVPLRTACRMMKLAHVLENPVTVVYSIIMCFWGVIFMVLWRRKQAVLRVQWNLYDITVDRSTRPKYIKAAHAQRVSSLTGDIEHSLSIKRKIFGKVASYLGVLLMFCLYCLAVVSAMCYRLNVMYYGRKSTNKTFREYLLLFQNITSSFLSLLIMLLYDACIPSACKLFTEWEKPRTEYDFDRIYAIKIVLFSFGNTFFPILYLAFVKGHFYTHPGDPTQWTILGIFKADVCPASGCLVELSLLLGTVMVVRNAVRLFMEMMKPCATWMTWGTWKESLRVCEGYCMYPIVVITRANTWVSIHESCEGFTCWILHIKIVKVFIGKFKYPNMPMGYQWEEDFILLPTDRNFLHAEYIQMVLQYGFVTFFLVSLPIAPLLALINNIVELRLDALKMLRKFRRILPRKVIGIEEWNVVLQVITVLGAISNPLLIAFSSKLIPRHIYVLKNNYSHEGFINSTLSEFSVSDYPGHLYRLPKAVVETCQYVGMRYPPSHPKKYERTAEFWYQFSVKLLFFIILENICLLLSLFLGYIIPEIPREVEIKLEHDQITLQRMRLRQSRN